MLMTEPERGEVAKSAFQGQDRSVASPVDDSGRSERRASSFPPSRIYLVDQRRTCCRPDLSAENELDLLSRMAEASPLPPFLSSKSTCDHVGLPSSEEIAR